MGKSLRKKPKKKELPQQNNYLCEVEVPNFATMIQAVNEVEARNNFIKRLSTIRLVSVANRYSITVKKSDKAAQNTTASEPDL